jgi:hypothetical protein
MEETMRPGRCEGRCRSAAEVEAVLGPSVRPRNMRTCTDFFYAEASHEGGELEQGAFLSLPCDLRCKYRGHPFQDQFHPYVQWIHHPRGIRTLFK